MKKSMRKEWEWSTFTTYLQTNQKITLSSFLKITKTQNTTQSLENIIIIFLDKKGSFSLPPLPLNIF